MVMAMAAISDDKSAITDLRADIGRVARSVSGRTNHSMHFTGACMTSLKSDRDYRALH